MAKTRKIDMFTATKALSDRVADFINKKAEYKNIQVKYDNEIADAESAIRGLDNCRGSILPDVDDIDTQIQTIEAHIATLKEDKAKFLKAERFEWNDADRAMFKGYQNAESDDDILEAINVWCESWELQSRGTDFVAHLCEITGGCAMRRKNTDRAWVNSGCTEFNRNGRTRTDILTTIYGELAEKMIEVGTLKPVMVNELVREKYAPKKKADNQ